MIDFVIEEKSGIELGGKLSRCQTTVGIAEVGLAMAEDNQTTATWV